MGGGSKFLTDNTERSRDEKEESKELLYNIENVKCNFKHRSRQ